MPPIRRAIFVSLTFVVLGLFAPHSIKADTVVIGGTNGNNCYPFGHCGYAGPHQQFYSSSQFSGPVTITQISFASGSPTSPGGGGAATYSFSLGLSNTSATPSSFNATYAANRGANFTTAFNGPFAATLQANNASQTFDFNIILTTPFLYDPSQGNLLVEINMMSSSGPLNFFWAGASPLTGRNFNNPPGNTTTGLGPGAAFASNFGLLTQFTFAPAAPTAVPEPTSMLLLGTGLAGMAALRKRRKARKSEEV